MTIDRDAIRAIVFDYGNTLVPFGSEDVERMNAALTETLGRHYGSVDRGRLDEIRATDRMQPYERDYRENDLAELCTNLVRELYGSEPSETVVQDLLRTRYEIFLAVIALPDGVLQLLEQLSGRFALGVLSNYPDGDVVRASMEKIGIRHVFRTVVVSGDSGYIKPHPAPYRAVVEGMGIEPKHTLFVGDNWLADVQGAKRFGMQAALIKQYAPLEQFDPSEGDHEPDLVIGHLDELATHLLD